MSYNVRRADLGDLEKLVSFTMSEAEEAEGAHKQKDVVQRGIRTALEDPTVATYWVLAHTEHGVIGNISIVKEWSNWHAGYYWWIQSMYLREPFRGQGLMNLLLARVKEAARSENALDLRLCVHKDNRRAIRAYQKAGFVESVYQIMVANLVGAGGVYG